MIPKTNICWDSAHSDATQICPTQQKNLEGGAGYEILDLLATHRIMDMPKIQETFSLSYFAAATSAPVKYIQALAAEPRDRRGIVATHHGIIMASSWEHHGIIMTSTT